MQDYHQPKTKYTCSCATCRKPTSHDARYCSPCSVEQLAALKFTVPIPATVRA
jgi:hypothetical protein